MPLTMQIVQMLLPMTLLAWLFLLPAGGLLALVLQCLAVGVILVALLLVGLWTLPPWWFPWLCLILYAGVLIWHGMNGRYGGDLLWAPGYLNGSAIFLTLLLSAYAVALIVQALAGRAPPNDVDVVDLALPFGPGNYLIAHGGSHPTINGHLRTLDTEQERFREWRGQSRALDIFRLTSLGLHTTQGLKPADPAAYATFGAPLLAPCDGIIARVVDGLQDMPVPQMDTDNMAGNFIAIECSGVYVILAHLRQGSVLVQEGDVVSAGTLLAEMGNSGNSSEPHLHMHVQRDLPENAPLSGEPLVMTFNGQFPVRNTIIRVP